MKMIIVFVTTFSLSAFGTDAFLKKQRFIKSITSIKTQIEKIKEKEVVSELRQFVNSSKGRLVGTDSHQKSRIYLEQRIKELDPGIKTQSSSFSVEEFTPDLAYGHAFYQKDFDDQIKNKLNPADPQYKKWDFFTKNTQNFLQSKKGIKGYNLVWEKKGLVNPNQFIILSAHYDTIAHDPKTLKITPEKDMPGADDNGSGVAILLQLISTLSQLDLDKTVRIVFFDFEELAFLGSRSYVETHLDELKSTNFKGLLNLEMLGHDSKKGPKVKKSGDMKIYIRAQNLDGGKLDQEMIAPIKKCSDKVVSQVDFNLEANSFNSSDHINFWEKDLKAVTFSQNWEEDFNQARYHTSNDFVETINLKTFFYSARYISASLLCWNYDIL